MLENKTVLVVEADAHALVVISKQLRELGVDFKRNTNGARVVDQLRRYSPDVVLIDLELPLANAFDLKQECGRHPELAHIPFVAVGPRGNPALRAQAAACGFAGFVGKPLSPRQFARTLQRTCVGETAKQH